MCQWLIFVQGIGNTALPAVYALCGQEEARKLFSYPFFLHHAFTPTAVAPRSMKHICRQQGRMLEH
jgi:hypothetical protein